MCKLINDLMFQIGIYLFAKFVLDYNQSSKSIRYVVLFVTIGIQFLLSFNYSIKTLLTCDIDNIFFKKQGSHISTMTIKSDVSYFHFKS